MWLLALACTPPDGDKPGSTPPTDTHPQTTPTNPTDPTDPTNPTTPTVPVDVAVSGLSWDLDPVVESVVHTHWTQDGPATVHVEYQVDGAWESTPSFAATAGEQDQVVVGVPYDTTAAWRVVVEGGDTTDGEAFTTGAIPADLPLPTLELAESSAWWPDGRFLLASLNQEGGGWGGGHFWTFLLDRQARVVWARPTPSTHWTLYAQVAVTGDHVLWEEDTFWSEFDSGAGSVVHQSWLDGDFGEISTPGLHQAWLQKPDGTLAWGSRYDVPAWDEEAIVEKAPGQTDETVIWSCATDWPQAAGPSCHINGLFYVEATDTYLLSDALYDSILEMSRTSASPDDTPGETLWWAGDVSGGYDFDPADFPLEWEHGPCWTPQGTLLISSNHDGTDWAVEYEVDHTAQTVRKVWASDSQVTLDDMGHTWRLPNGNTLHLTGDGGVIREIDPGGADIWRASFANHNLLGRGEWITDLYALVAPR